MSDRHPTRQTAPQRPSVSSRKASSASSRSGHEKAAHPPRETPGWRPPCSAITGDVSSTTHLTLSTPEALRAFLEGLNGDAGAPTAEVFGVATAAAAVAAEGRGAGKPRLILRGIAPAFLRVLVDSSPLGIDAGFVEAHVARRRWGRYNRPRLFLGRDAAQWNYPELVGGFARAGWRGGEGGGGGAAAALSVVVDGLGRAAVRAVSDCEDLAAVECRASVWVGERVDVLLLDKPVWEEEGALLTRARRRKAGLVLKGRVDETDKQGWDAPDVEDDEVSSLEDSLQQAMSTDATFINLVDVLEEAAYDKWLDFFEVLTPRQAPLVVDGTSLEWRALQALEGNLDMATTLSQRRRQDSSDPSPDWSSLIQRLRDRTALLATVPPTQSLDPSTMPPHFKARSRALRTDNFTAPPLPRRRRRRQRRRSRSPLRGGSSGGGDENQRALDRVTYLGGILLPISLVSSVLSMNEDFEPGQRLFWVFWAAAVPLTLVTFVVIYADKLRSAEVWVEIGSLSSVGSASGDQATAAAVEEEARGNKGRRKRERERERKEKMHEEQWDASEQNWGNWAVDSRAKRERRPTVRPQATAYAGEDVVIDLSDAVAQPQSIPLEPRTANQPDHHDDDDDDDDDNDGEEHDEETHRSSSSSEDEDMADPTTYITHPTDGTRPHAWRKKQLGWGGAAMCILRMQKPLRVEDGLPVAAAPGPRRDVEKRLQQARRRASVEGRRSLSY